MWGRSRSGKLLYPFIPIKIPTRTTTTESSMTLISNTEGLKTVQPLTILSQVCICTLHFLGWRAVRTSDSLQKTSLITRDNEGCESMKPWSEFPGCPACKPSSKVKDSPENFSDYQREWGQWEHMKSWSEFPGCVSTLGALLRGEGFSSTAGIAPKPHPQCQGSQVITPASMKNLICCCLSFN